ADTPEYHVRTRTDPGTRGDASYATSATSYGATKDTTSGMDRRLARHDAQPFSAPAVRPPASHLSLRKKSTMIGTVRITEPAIRTVVGTSMLPESWERPSETVHFDRLSTRNSRAKRNSFHAIINTNSALEAIAGSASGRLM